jgi:hypothetical protein
MPQQRLYFFPLPQGQGAFFEGLCCIRDGIRYGTVDWRERHCTQDRRAHASGLQLQALIT